MLVVKAFVWRIARLQLHEQASLKLLSCLDFSLTLRVGQEPTHPVFFVFCNIMIP
jgi:hypothetical protein